MAAEYSEHKPSNVLSCTLKMLQGFECTSEVVLYKSLPVSSVETVARVKELRESSLRYEILLEDSTGTFQAFLYKKQVNGKDSSLSHFQYKDNAFALICGNFRKTQDSPMFIISSISNINSRSYIDYFLSIVLQGYIRLFKPVIETTDVFELVLKAFSAAPNNPKGYTSTTISQYLPSKLPLNKIEDALNELLMVNRLKNGCDWNHYRLPL